MEEEYPTAIAGEPALDRVTGQGVVEEEGAVRRFKVRVLSAAAVMLLLAAACDEGGGGGTAATGPGQGDSPDEALVLGFVASYSGPTGVYGPPGENAVRLALDDVNEAGGVFGKPVELVIGDDASSSEQSLAEAQRVVNVEGAQVILHGGGSGANLAVKEGLTKPDSILQTCAICVSPAHTIDQSNQQGNFFRFRPGVNALMDPIAGVLAAKEVANVCVIYVDNAYGQTAAERFQEFYPTLVQGASVQTASTPDAVVQSRLAELTECTNNGHDIVVPATFGVGQGDQIMKEGFENGLVSEFYMPEDLEVPDIYDQLGWKNFDGTIGFSGAAAQGSGLDFFSEAYEEAYGGPVEISLTEFQYDPVAAVSLAAAWANSLEFEAIRDALYEVANAPGEPIGPGADELKRAFDLIAQGEDIDYQGVSGIDFADNGEPVAGTGRLWHVDAATETIVNDGYGVYDPTTEQFTFEPLPDCTICDPFGDLDG